MKGGGGGVTGPSASPERRPTSELCVRECHPLRPGLGPRECGSQLSADHHHVACSQARKNRARPCREVDCLCFTPPLVAQSGRQGGRPANQLVHKSRAHFKLFPDSLLYLLRYCSPSWMTFYPFGDRRDLYPQLQSCKECWNKEGVGCPEVWCLKMFR